MRRLVSKTRTVVPDGGDGWTVHYAFFTRSGFTEAAATEARQHGALMVSLDTLGGDLGA